MHTIEPYYNWRDYYIAEEDERSPFFEKEYSEFYYTDTIYNYYIHPQWDYIGSPTLYIKILFVNYDTGYAIIELMGEWNDALHNDIMFLKRDVIDFLLKEGITKYILIGENILNFHRSDDCYYQEWVDDVQDQDGWVVGLNFVDHVLDEMYRAFIHYQFYIGENYTDVSWRKFKPNHVCELVQSLILKGIE